jgi:hypothetical protein
MNKIILITFFSLFITGICHAQATDLVKEEWTEKPSLHTISSAFKNDPAIIILQKIRVEYRDEPNGEVSEYYTRHNIVRVNDEKGIEMFNKIYLGAGNSIEISDLKARTILPSGKIIEINKNNIRDLKEEDGGVYKIFAMEGLEKGCELEYIYTFKKESSFFGRITVQGSTPIEITRFEIIAPERLVFEIKPYNFTTAVLDTVTGGKRIAGVTIEATRGIEEEKYASYEVNLKRLEYKLSYNNSTKSGERLFTWNEMAKRIYSNYTSFKEKELSKTDGLIKQNGWDKLTGEEEKIISVENALKKNFITRSNIEGADVSNIENIIKNKIASFKGIMRLYGAIFRQMNVDYQFVFVCDRNEYIIDNSFENWNNCESPVFYFPSLKKFMAPTRPDLRYPCIFPSWGAANGLFCKTITIGTFSTAIGEIRPVPLEGFKNNYSNIESKIELNKNNDTLLVDMKQLYGGYEAAYYRAGYNYASAEGKRNFIRELVKFGTNSENIISSELINPELENASSSKPFIVHASVKAGELLENASNKLLVKIGEVIGPQVEMYQEKPRQLPVKIEYPHFQERKIDLVIPEGYVIKNINDLKLEHVFRQNGEITMGFSSDYALKGNLLSIHIMEEYRKTIYPISEYEEFKKVINTSADFNKIILVLEKK